ncbi:MAG: hypothetical protein H6981_01285 [Gammaproteobacteria bacterium]|nr:hypothetical protein [Gammaproteobacteria bacterium]MCP5135419.1 hypothetical protein [Gammaproteobacteria bacterium]
MQPQSILRISEVHSLFADAVLVDSKGYLTMASIWGRDTGIQELLGRMTLGPNEQDSIDSLHFEGEHSFEALVGDARRLDKLNGRVPGTLFGELVHLFIFDQKVLKPDLGNRKAVVLSRSEDVSLSDRIWATVRELAAIPLLDDWRDHILPVFEERGWIESRRGIGVHGTWLHLPDDEVDDLVGGMIRDFQLPIAA